MNQEAEPKSKFGESKLPAEGLRRGIVWDEETIAIHDQDRGTRMVIDEPKTPYHGPQPDPDGGDEFESRLCLDLNAAPPPQKAPPSFHLDDLKKGLDKAKAEEEKKAEFLRKRREHYQIAKPGTDQLSDDEDEVGAEAEETSSEDSKQGEGL